MTSFVLERRALCISAVATLLAGCGGSQVPLTAPPAERFSGDSLPYHRTFHYTGREQSFKVPLGVKWITVVALGAGGGGSLGGRGGRVSGEIPVKPGEHLAIFVGGAGTTITGGYNGGGPGVYGSGSTDSYGGGGASDVREGGNGLQNRALVVGGAAAKEAAPPRVPAEPGAALSAAVTLTRPAAAGEAVRNIAAETGERAVSAGAAAEAAARPTPSRARENIRAGEGGSGPTATASSFLAGSAHEK
jgi:hypothetical protein